MADVDRKDKQLWGMPVSSPPLSALYLPLPQALHVGRRSLRLLPLELPGLGEKYDVLSIGRGRRADGRIN